MRYGSLAPSFTRLLVGTASSSLEAIPLTQRLTVNMVISVRIIKVITEHSLYEGQRLTLKEVKNYSSLALTVSTYMNKNKGISYRLTSLTKIVCLWFWEITRVLWLFIELVIKITCDWPRRIQFFCLRFLLPQLSSLF
jgi:hypothetical protein